MTKKPAYILGAGGHAHVIASLLDVPVTFVVPDPVDESHIDTEEFFREIDLYRSSSIFIGIGDNAVRRGLFERLQGLDVTPAICVARHSFVARDAHLGPGTVLCPGSVIGSRAQVGANTIVNTLSSIDHDCTLGDHSQVAGGVTFAGRVSTGPRCFFGVKCSIVPGVSIGADVVVMAGALVTRDVPDGVMVGGTPARIFRNLQRESE